MASFWINNPSILLKHDNLKYFWPTEKMTSYEKLNAITRLVIYLTVISSLLMEEKVKFILIGLVTIVLIISLYYINKDKDVKENIEGFNNQIQPTNWTMPTPKNPAMNVMLTDIQDNPTRKSAAPVTKEINKKIDESAKKYIIGNYKDVDGDLKDKIYRDLGDSLNFDHSMRSWYPMPNTQIPNDQKSFANFCYGDMPSCKEGSTLACSKNLPHRWMKN